MFESKGDIILESMCYYREYIMAVLFQWLWYPTEFLTMTYNTLSFCKGNSIIKGQKKKKKIRIAITN